MDNVGQEFNYFFEEDENVYNDYHYPTSTQWSDQAQCILSPASTTSTLSCNLDPDDLQLQQVADKARQSGTLTPLVKEELKCSIMVRRHKEGKPELPVLEPVTPTTYSEATILKIQDRRERNRIAAKKCRTKKKLEVDLILLELQSAIKKNHLLVQKNKILEEKVYKLEQARSYLYTLDHE